MFGFIFNNIGQWWLIKSFKHRFIIVFMCFRYSFSRYFVLKKRNLFKRPYANFWRARLLSGQPLLSGQLPFPRGWPLYRGSTVMPNYLSTSCDHFSDTPFFIIELEWGYQDLSFCKVLNRFFKNLAKRWILICWLQFDNKKWGSPNSF